MSLLSKDFNVTGKHSLMFEALKQSGIFKYFWQIYIVAPIVGLMYKRKVQPDKSEQNSTIFLSQLTPRRDLIYFIYRLVLLRDENYETNPQERIKKAFLTMDSSTSVSDEQLFYSYLLGGTEILHEKLIEKTPDIINNIGDFIKELNITDESLIDEFGISKNM